MTDRRVAGIVMVLAAGFIYSTAGLFTHALPLDAWTILAWRAVFGTAFMLAWMGAGAPGGRGSFAIGWGGLALAVPTALCSAWSNWSKTSSAKTEARCPAKLPPFRTPP